MSGASGGALARLLAARLAELPGVTPAQSRIGTPGRPAWRAGTREIAHLHGDTVIDIRLPRAEQRRRSDDPRLLPRDATADWIECRFVRSGDLDLVVELVALAARAARRGTK